MIVTAWQAIPGTLLIYIAGLLAVPGDVYEAAGLDGASKTQQLLRITLPLVAGYVVINVILGFKGFLNAYDIIVGLTGGGPGTATRSVAMSIILGFNGGDYAYQMANAALFFVVSPSSSRSCTLADPGKEHPVMTALNQPALAVEQAELNAPRASGACLASSPRAAARVARRHGARQLVHDDPSWCLRPHRAAALYVTVSMALKSGTQVVDGNAFSFPSPISFDGSSRRGR